MTSLGGALDLTKALVFIVLLALSAEKCHSILFDDQPSCEDKYTACPYFAKIYQCYIQAVYMMCRCVISCHTPNICNVTSGNDTVSNDSNDTDCKCRYYAQLDLCSRYRERCQTTCSIRDTVICPEPEQHNLTTIVPRKTTYSYLDTYKHVCVEGYKNVGDDPNMVCVENGTWVNPQNLKLPNCQLKYCGSPPDLPNSSWQADHFYYKGIANYTCQQGYEMTSSSIMTCGGEEKWVGQVSCKGIDCGPPPSVGHSSFSTDSTRYPAVATYICERGYNLTSGQNVKSCSENATWIGSDVECTIVSCGSPPVVNNTRVAVDTLEYQSTANYTCARGYNVTSGSDVKTCREDGRWEGDDLVCKIVSCGPPPQIENTTTLYEEVTFGSVAVYMCIEGYKPITGSDVRICDESGAWSGSPLVCFLVTCDNPPLPPNSYIVSTYSTVYMSRVNYSCALGFEMVSGSDVKLCSADGLWEGESIECKEKPSVAETIGIITNFEPEVLEAQGSVGFGVAAFAIVVVIVVAIVLLDLTTICHHVRFMKGNVRDFVDRVKTRFFCSSANAEHPVKEC